MSNFIPNREFLHRILLHYFHKKESVYESIRILVEVYGFQAPSERTCLNWFKLFESGNFELEDEDPAGAFKMIEEHAGTSKMIEEIYKEMMKSSNGETDKRKATHPEPLSSTKKMFLRKVFLYYYESVKNIDFSENHNFLSQIFEGDAKAELFCLCLVKKIKNGEYDFDCVEQAEMLKKIEEMETKKREGRFVNIGLVSHRVNHKYKSIDHHLKRGKDIRASENWVAQPVPSPKKVFLHQVLLHYFNMKKSILESYEYLLHVYGDQAPGERTCMMWFRQFRSGNFDLKNEVQIGRPKKFDDEKLKALLRDDSSRTQHEIANILGVTQKAISHRLKKLGIIRKDGEWIPT